ncbi:hypothetical protein LguiB_003363 [Lonicera macranthoides]
MPPEPLPWDRKDFFKERKHSERSSETLGGSLPRWRDTPHHGPYRWGSAEFRRPPGHGKQGGWHMFEESGHGFAPTRSIDKILDDESCRPSGSRGEGKYGRNSRENRGSFSQRDWKGSSWEIGASPNGPVRQADVSDQRSVDDLTYNSHPHSDSWDQFHFKDQHDKIGGLGTGPRFDRDNAMGSIDWKPLKWTRSGSLSSRGSSFSHSSSSKSIGVDSNEMKAEAHPRNVTPVQSPSGDAAACVTSAAPNEEMNSRKKPRLGWGEGLAKYEKKRVEGPDDIAPKNGMVTCGGNTEPLHSHISHMADKSPRVAGYSECASPATPSSVACSSSPGLEDKPFAKAANVDTGTSKLSVSPRPVPQNLCEVLPFNLENLEPVPVPNLCSSLDELLQPDDPSSIDSAFVRYSAMNKLLILKANISKSLEMTESEIDLLENELKTLRSDSAITFPRPASSSSLPVTCKANPNEEPYAASNLIPRPAPLEFLSSGEMILEKTLCSQEREHAEGKDQDIDSPGTATSKFVEPLSSGKAVFPSDTVKNGDCSGNVDIRPENFEEKCSVDGINGEMTDASACADGILLVASSSSTTLSTDIGVNCDRDVILCDLILTANKDSARRASEVFSKLLPSSNISTLASGPCWKSDPLIKEKFARRKHFLRFKERVITLKFRAFQHLWKEDLRLLSIRRHRAKSQKRFELSSRNGHSSNQKHRSSIRSRFSSPAGNLSLVPTTEIINYASKLLSDSQVQIHRSTLKMPSLILDRKEKIISRFITKNGLVEDACTVEKERCMINPWTSEEKIIFMEKFAIHGKDFRKIAAFLDHKTTADCVEFYYKNHKADCFPKTKKKPEFAKQGKSYSSSTYLVTSGKRWNREASAIASLDMLGAATAIAANVDGGIESHNKRASRFFFGGSGDYKTPRVEDGTVERSTNLDIFCSERETVAADVLAGICGSLSSEAMSSCITSSVDPGEAYQQDQRMCQKMGGSSVRRPLTPEVTQNVDDETCSDESCGEMDPSDWTDEEKSIFIRAVSSYGKDFRMISRCVRTRSTNQCKVFFSKARKCLGLDMVQPGPGNEGTRMSDDANGGGSDTEDACIVETGSIICSDKSELKMDEDLRLLDLKATNDESDPPVTLKMDQSEENNGIGEVEFKDSELKSEILASDDCEAEHKPELDCDGDSNIDNGVASVGVGENAVIHSGTEAGESEATGHESMEETLSGGEGNDHDLPPVSSAEAETMAVGQVFAEYSRPEMVEHELLLPGSSSNDKRVESRDANTSSASGSCLVQDSNSIPQSVENVPVLISDPLHMSSPILDFGKISPEQCEKSVELSGPSLLDHVESSQILRGYPVSVSSSKKGMNGFINGKNPALHQSLMPKLDSKSQSDSYLLQQDCYLRKCNNDRKRHHSSLSELQLLSNQKERKDHTRPQTSSSSDEVKPCRNSNNVKLFGQILTHTASQHEQPNSSTSENDDKEPEQSKLSGKSFNLKFTGSQSLDGKVERHNYLAYDNRPVRSYGFWDGNRIQTGFPSLPDSAMLLAKYPAAFGNYPLSSSKIEQQQQPLHPVVKSNEHKLNAVSVFPTREIISSNGVSDYQVYRSRDSTKVQPFTVDMKQRQEKLISEMQRRSEIESVSNMQQQTRGMVGIVGRGGILVGGGPCSTGVSDPVAAIKLHYAKKENLNGQGGGGSVISEQQESWRGNGGDIGR